MKIVLDAGHGYNTSGKRTPDGSMREWEFNSKVAEYLKAELMNYEGVEVLFVHDTTGKVDVPLAKRVQSSNNFKADLYISIHANANTGQWGSWGGTETYVYKGSKASETIGTAVHNHLIKDTGLRNRGVKEGNWLYVVKNTNAPAILLEAAFMDNKEEAALLKSDSYRRKVAKSVLNALVEVYKLKTKAQPKPTPTPQPKAEEGKYYRLQLGAYSNKENALKEQQRLEKLGIKTTLKYN